jgi:DNA-binding transcriptional regulator YdaS (Cro superfamily)
VQKRIALEKYEQCSYTAAMDIQNYMAHHGLTQRDFGALVGVTPSMVSQWVRGVRPVSPIKALAIEAATRREICASSFHPELFGGVKVP